MNITLLQKRLRAFTRDKFKERTYTEQRTAPIHHLKEEVEEILEAINKYSSFSDVVDMDEMHEARVELIYEFADALLLILASIEHCRIRTDELTHACWSKLETCESSEWKLVDKETKVYKRIK